MSTILLVAHDPFVTQQLYKALSEDGHTALIAPSRSEALSILQKRADIDLLFIDVRKPASIMDYVLAQQARRLRPTLSVLYGTAATIETNNGGTFPAHLGVVKTPYEPTQVRTKAAP
jgi:CheY-like chemotaxis protein